MKPSSRIMAIRVSQSTEFPKTDASVSTGYYKASELERTVNALIEYLDEQAKLLDTHTVKEEKGECTHQFITVDTGVSQKRRCAFCNKDEPQKEEPTTPEKKCCSIDGKDGYHSLLCSRPDLKEEKKLPTSSYEVTCGRCEKLFYHRCGKV